MELQGNVIQLLDEQSGDGKNGKWRKREYVIETGGQYPRKICFNLWGDKIDQFPMKVGDSVNVFFDIESRDFNGRWYTDVKAWKVESASKSDGKSVNSQSAGQDLQSPPEMNNIPLPGEDDLPF
jgi:hypothetical protein